MLFTSYLPVLPFWSVKIKGLQGSIRRLPCCIQRRRLTCPMCLQALKALHTRAGLPVILPGQPGLAGCLLTLSLSLSLSLSRHHTMSQAGEGTALKKEEWRENRGGSKGGSGGRPPPSKICATPKKRSNKAPPGIRTES